jgi:hypothetical protein
MNINRIFVFAAAMLITVGAFAQEQQGRIKPVRLGVSVTVGSNAYAGISALPGTLASYGTQAPSINWMDKGPAFGVEGSMIICDKWKLDLGGAFTYSFNPAYPRYEGTGEGLGEIPTYEPVAFQQSASYLVYLAGSYYFRIKSIPALRPSIGIRLGASYGNNQRLATEDDMLGGFSASETVRLGAAAIAGIDYYFSPHFFVGMGVDLFRYVYGFNAHRPQEGLGVLGADTHNFGFLGAPKIKIGFVF